LLRTSLVDAGIAKPTFELLTNSDPEVQIEATNVCANLVIEFSPMREELVSEGVVATLCAHARLASPTLRLSSLWVIKHLVHVAPKELRISVLGELGTGWLVSAITGEHGQGQNDRGAAENSNSNGGVSVGMGSNAAGEQVEILNPSSGMDLDEDEDNEDHPQDTDDGEIMYDEPSNTHYQASSLRSTLPALQTSVFNSARYLASIRENEQNPALQARRNDIAIQEQALDFLRNLIGGDCCAEMAEYIFQELGHQKIFDLLTVKLSPISLSHRSSSSNSGAGQPIYHPTSLVAAAIHVIIHLANGSRSQKSLLVSQRPLLQAWLPHFEHSDRHVRVLCTWGVNNLTWIEDERDRVEARLRVQALREVGIEAAVRKLVNDSDLDVRERVKTALRQIEGL
jgi:hypothetical protein